MIHDDALLELPQISEKEHVSILDLAEMNFGHVPARMLYTC